MARATAKNRRRPWLTGLIRLLSRLSLPLLYGLADVLYVLLFHLLRFQRTLVLDNIRSAFPDLAPAARQRIAARSYRNTLHVLFETISARTLTARQLSERVTIDNPELIHALLQKHATLVVAAAHQGNWEWMQLACAAQLNIPIATLYKPVSHSDLDALLLELRGRFGSTLIPASGSLRGLLGFARSGGAVAILADQGPRPDEEQYWSSFLGLDTAFFPGLEKLTILLKAPLVFVHMQRTGKGYYRLRMEQLSETADPGVMERYIRCVEAQVRAAPEDWLWVYKRWKYQRPASNPL